ncbi:hypothetical protein TWF679_007626 [Orbilia oligospora]|uniref:CorA-like transporter domain-containing protein n=1 Tax=Orbilia oligospora TaxID=2813651 RepID=A0A8H8V733_ORBOL|nr:hypothetical protein TWF679_007626 [Orbilia oligospora]
MGKFEEMSSDSWTPRDAHQRLFRRHASDLFDESDTDVECLRVLPNHQHLQQHKINDSSLKELRGILEENQVQANEIFYIIRQKNTLSRLKISEQGLRLIIDAHNLSTRFLRVVTSFGWRRNDEHRAWDGYYTSPTRPRPPPRNSNDSSELSYVVRYVERRTDKPSQNPWSVRQVGVCQQRTVCNNKKHSIWVLLQPSKYVYEELKDTLERRLQNQNTTPSVEDSCSLHLDILESLASSWAEYVEWSWGEVESQDDKATLPGLRFPTEKDLEDLFEAAQKVQRVRRRLLRALSVLDSNYALADGIAAHFPDILTTRIANYKAEIQSHRRNILLMTEHLKETSYLLFNILSFRNDKFSLEGNQAMQQSLSLMGTIAQQGRQDSTTLKLLSMIATLYLPASLVATIFSSNLIELKSDENGGDRFHVVSQFWLYILVAIALTVLTFICGAFVLRKKILEDIRKYRTKLKEKMSGLEPEKVGRMEEV